MIALLTQSPIYLALKLDIAEMFHSCGGVQIINKISIFGNVASQSRRRIGKQNVAVNRELTKVDWCVRISDRRLEGTNASDWPLSRPRNEVTRPADLAARRRLAQNGMTHNDASLKGIWAQGRVVLKSSSHKVWKTSYASLVKKWRENFEIVLKRKIQKVHK